jgi:hypothetical protein
MLATVQISDAREGRAARTRGRGLEDEKQCILVLIGATPEGRKVPIGFTDDARDWRDLLLKDNGAGSM